MTTIALDDNWLCAFAPADSDLPTFAASQAIDSLANWTADAQQVAWLKRIFILEPTDYCVNYVLQIAAAPAGTRLYLNGEQVPNLLDSPPFEVDITLHVALDDNEILFRVEPDASGRFAGVELRPVPCD